MNNPLLDFSDLPRFEAILPIHVKPAISQLLTEANALIVQLGEDPKEPTWDNFAAPLINGLEPLTRSWGQVSHLHSVVDIPEWREAYNELLPEVSAFFAQVGQNLALYVRYKKLRESAAFAMGIPSFQVESAARKARERILPAFLQKRMRMGI